MTTVAERKQTERDETRDKLLATGLVSPGATIYTVLRHVSRSGMTRHIDMYAMTEGEPFYLSGYAATIMDDRRNDSGAIIVGGCGMDMGFHLTYNLSRYLYRDGFECINPTDPYGYNDRSKRCPSNDHSNYRNGDCPTSHTDGGYALNHRWL